MTFQRTSDLPDAFFTIGPRICAALGCAWADLLAVMFLESGCYSSACNKGSNASGLIQFVPSTLRGLGWTDTPEAFRQLNAAAQLPFVQKHFQPHAGKLDSLQAVYLVVFEPAHLDLRTDTGAILAEADSAIAKANPALRDSDGAIRVGSLARAAKMSCKGSRWEEIAFRAGLLDGPPA